MSSEAKMSSEVNFGFFRPKFTSELINRLRAHFTVTRLIAAPSSMPSTTPMPAVTRAKTV